MAKFIYQIVLLGAQVVGRAFAKALRQEINASKEAAQRLGNAEVAKEKRANARLGLTLEEAKQILNVSELDKEKINERYEHLFNANDKTRGGSFYIQSKVVRAKERLDAELARQEPQPDSDKNC